MCGRSEGYAQTGFSSFVRVVETCTNFQPGKACLNISKFKKKNVASNALSGISFLQAFLSQMERNSILHLLADSRSFQTYGRGQISILHTAYKCFTLIDVNELRNMS